MQLELRKLQKSVGITFIFVTHDQEEAMTMSDRVAVMNSGKILQVSPPKILYENPANLFVGDFIGDINLLNAQISNIEGKKIKVLINSLGEYNLEAHTPINRDDLIVCGIRPKAINISFDDKKISDIQIKGKVSNTSFYGNLTYVYVNIEGLEKAIMLSTSKDLPGLSQNSDCFLNINLEDIRIIKKN